MEDKKVLSERLEPAPGVLYLVGTPIGHLGDLSPRAKSLLRKVSYIACEDTRHSGQMLKNLGVQGSLLSFHRHNTKNRLPKLLHLLKENQTLALITDAGLPGISDPGQELVSEARKAGQEVICVPGPCAATTALVSSGLPSNRFCFEGFLPSKGKARANLLKNISKEERTTIIYESPHRLIKLLEELASLCGHDRPMQIARELTKRHEQQIGPTIGKALEHFSKAKPIGECTVVLGGTTSPSNNEANEPNLLADMQALVAEGNTASDAVKKVANVTGHSRRHLYELLHSKELANDI